MIYISSDHRGYELKNYLVQELIGLGYQVKDMGPLKLEVDDDYPDYAIPLAKKIQENPKDKGILICHNGVGVSIAANRYKGVKAALSWDAKHAASSRNDDDTNVLALPADFIEQKDALNIVETWLQTPFDANERRTRRLAKLDA